MDRYRSWRQMRRLRHASISQAEHIFNAVQGEMGADDYIRPYREPGYYVRRGMMPPQWNRGSSDHEYEEPVCPECGETADCRTYLPDRGERYWHHDHESRTAPDMEAACIEEVAA